MDGDTVEVLRQTAAGPRPVKVRLDGIDAPEKGQDFGNRAKQHLSDLVYGKTVWVEVMDTDRYGRQVGRVMVNGRDTSNEMVRNGMAWHFKKYSSDTLLGIYETEARRARRGLWAHAALPPWDYRDGKREIPPDRPTVEAPVGGTLSDQDRNARELRRAEEQAASSSEQERRKRLLPEQEAPRRSKAAERLVAIKKWHQLYVEAFEPTKRLGLEVARSYNARDYQALAEACRGLAVAVSTTRSALPSDEVPDQNVRISLGLMLQAYSRTARECQQGRMQRFAEYAQDATRAFQDLGRDLAIYRLVP